MSNYHICLQHLCRCWHGFDTRRLLRLHLTRIIGRYPRAAPHLSSPPAQGRSGSTSSYLARSNSLRLQPASEKICIYDRAGMTYVPVLAGDLDCICR